MKPDPRACQVSPADFNHLTLAEVMELDRLVAEMSANRQRHLPAAKSRRFSELSARRHPPIYDIRKWKLEIARG